jgi:hypothetical protein
MQSNPRRIKVYCDAFCWYCCGEMVMYRTPGGVKVKERPIHRRGHVQNSKRKTLRTHRTGH